MPVWVGVWLAIVPAWCAQAALPGRVLERVDVSTSAAGDAVQLVLNVPMRYVTHTPPERGDVLTITLRLADGTVTADDLAGVEESLPGPNTARVPLTEVHFSGAGQPSLVLRFTHPVRYTVAQGRDFRSIAVTLTAGVPSATVGGPTPELRRPGPALPAGLAAAPADAGAQDRVGRLMEQARQAMVDQDYDTAIRLYTKVSEDFPDDERARDALEFLGLARERRGQLAQAKRVYDEYLKRYPTGEGAERVRQRILALITATAKPRERLAEPAPAEAPAAEQKRRFEYEVFGGWSQFYRFDETDIQKQGADPIQASLINDLDITGRVTGEMADLRARFSGGYTHDFLADGPGDDKRVSSAYLEAADRAGDRMLRIGRQSHNSDGVLGRFDGIRGHYRLRDWLLMKAVFGAPVATSSSKVEFDKVFYGVSADLGPFREDWDFNVFFIEQQADGILDRRAMGGEIRYFAPRRSLFTFLDYDVSYASLNTFIFLGTLTVLRDTRLSLTLDVRNSPLLTTSNAIQGQGVVSLDQLFGRFSKGQLRRLAEDRTAVSRTATLSVTQPVTRHWQVTADVTASDLSGTPASAGVAATTGSGPDLFYATQLIGTSLATTGDTLIWGLRYSDVSTNKTISTDLNYRYPITRDWRLNPRLRIDHRRNDDHTQQWTLRPVLRTNYRWRRAVQLELELGSEWIWREVIGGPTERTLTYFASLGYRWQF